MTKFLPILAAAALIVASGFVNGTWTNRWGTSEALDRAVADLDKRVPTQVGDWVAVPKEALPEEDRELPADQVVKAKLAGHLLRQYVNRNNGTRVTVLLMCGRPGPVSVHTPDVCYQGAGYIQTGEEEYPSKEAPVGKLGRFEMKNSPGMLSILWTWDGGRGWQIPDNPRHQFASDPALYKLYVICKMDSRESRLQNDPRNGFVEKFLPELHQALFGGS